MKLFAALFVVLLPQLSFAQTSPGLNCAVKYKDQVSKMFWFAPNQSHHSEPALEYLSVMVQEKAEAGKVEITIIEAVEDATWDKFSEIVDGAGLPEEMRKNIRDLGRTRVTHAFVGLYAGVLQYEFRLGKDANLYEISCASNSAK